MGFLNREKARRECFSKGGKLCHKGYYYKYTLSGQGRKYVEWMKSAEPLDIGSYYGMISEVGRHIPDDAIRGIILSLLQREGGRYRGPNRKFQTFGVLIYAIPHLVRELNGQASQIDHLKMKCYHLWHMLEEKDAEIRNLKCENSSLRSNLDSKHRQASDLKRSFLKSIIDFLSIDKISFEIISGYRLLHIAQNAVIKDLAEVLVLIRPDACKLLPSIFNRQNG